MRNKILESLDQITGYLDFDIQCRISGKEYAADELTRLMCYREVRAFMKGIIYVNNSISSEEVIDCFIDTYEREQVIKAIEQVKNEII